MDWIQHVVSLLSAIIGGALVILGEQLRSRDESKGKRAETIVSLYTDFFVNFQMALHHNEAFWSGVLWQIEGKGSFTESDKSREARIASEIAFREAAWRLRLRERDRTQQERIEALARAFDEEIEDIGDYDATAFSYKDTAKKLREDGRVIVDRMQELHRKTLDLI